MKAPDAESPSRTSDLQHSAPFPLDGERLEPGREELRLSRPTRGYVARGECRQSRSCYLMGCPNQSCLDAHTRWTKQNRMTKLNLGRFSHGPVGYDCGCRCDACVPARARKYKREALAEIERLTQRRSA